MNSSIPRASSQEKLVEVHHETSTFTQTTDPLLKKAAVATNGLMSSYLDDNTKTDVFTVCNTIQQTLSGKKVSCPTEDPPGWGIDTPANLSAHQPKMLSPLDLNRAMSPLFLEIVE